MYSVRKGQWASQPAYSSAARTRPTAERGPLRAEEMLGQLAQLLPSHLLIALQKLIDLPHPAVQKAGGAQVAHSGLDGLQAH